MSSRLNSRLLRREWKPVPLMSPLELWKRGREREQRKRERRKRELEQWKLEHQQRLLELMRELELEQVRQERERERQERERERQEYEREQERKRLRRCLRKQLELALLKDVITRDILLTKNLHSLCEYLCFKRGRSHS